MNFITALFGAISNVFGWLKGRSDLKNAPDVKDAQKAQDQADANAAINEAITKKDTNEIRKDLAE